MKNFFKEPTLDFALPLNERHIWGYENLKSTVALKRVKAVVYMYGYVGSVVK